MPRAEEFRFRINQAWSSVRTALGAQGATQLLAAGQGGGIHRDDVGGRAERAWRKKATNVTAMPNHARPGATRLSGLDRREGRKVFEGEGQVAEASRGAVAPTARTGQRAPLRGCSWPGRRRRRAVKRAGLPLLRLWAMPHGPAQPIRPAQRGRYPARIDPEEAGQSSFPEDAWARPAGADRHPISGRALEGGGHKAREVGVSGRCKGFWQAPWDGAR